MAKKTKPKGDLKSIRARLDRRSNELQQCIQLIEGLDQRMAQERIRRERLIGAIGDLNEVIMEADPKGPEAKQLAEIRQNQESGEPAPKPEPAEPEAEKED